VFSRPRQCRRYASKRFLEAMMSRLAQLIVAVVCLITFLTLYPSLSFGQKSEPNILNQRVELHMTKMTLLSALSTLSVDWRIPIGFEADFERDVSDFCLAINECKLNLDYKGELKGALDLIIRQYPEYKWEFQDGVINFVSLNKRDPFLEKLLDTHIGSFTHKWGVDKFELRDSVLTLPEIKDLLGSENISVRKFDYVNYRSIYTNDDIDLSATDTTVRTILNKIVRESEHKMWLIERLGKDKQYFMLSF
jgi:hypothetical protein